MAEAVRRRIVVSGRVQGVFFRDSVRREAESAGLAGSARNLEDGTVEVILEGDKAAVRKIIDWCRAGPSAADVDSVEESEQEPQGTSGFRTR